ncbi:MAG: fumarylacetoacetate hydrolase family protein, partial [Sinomicrobium sp.]|nr:fumarylacetoacetate hydrolase family protein [Sinomicrobium sp.]
ISLGIDFTARDLQNYLKERGLPWEKAKAFDGSALIGEWQPKTTKDMDNINFHLHKNGHTVQQVNTSLMLWKTDELIAHISTYITLKTGDVIFTGTPAGVGKVSPGDRLEGYLEGKKVFAVDIK